MKTCTYCGKEYPDDSALCPVDGNPLSNGESNNTQEDTKSLPPVLPPALPRLVWTDRQARTFELILVCIIAFGGSLLASISILMGYNYENIHRGSLEWSAMALREITSLGLLWYILLKRGTSFRTLGLKWQLSDIGWAFLLVVAGTLAFSAINTSIYMSGLATGNYGTETARVGQILFGDGIFFSTFLLIFINPFFEELIVRAYIITEVKFLTNSAVTAVIISTLFQTSYHLYQGVPAALSNMGTFLVFSIYYAKTNRITPVILAHMYMDANGTLWYWMRH